MHNLHYTILGALLSQSCAHARIEQPKAQRIHVPGGDLNVLGKTIRISDFYLDKFEVSVEKYQECVAARACRPPDISVPGDRRQRSFDRWYRKKNCTYYQAKSKRKPVNCISSQDAADYCAWSGARLPTIYEWLWEYSGRGRYFQYPWGNTTPTCQTSVSLFCRSLGVKPVNVDSMPRSASQGGAYHLLGNISEIVTLTKNGSKASSIGGTWDDRWSFTQNYILDALRMEPLSTRNGTALGVRCAYSPPEQPSPTSAQ